MSPRGLRKVPLLNRFRTIRWFVVAALVGASVTVVPSALAQSPSPAPSGSPSDTPTPTPIATPTEVPSPVPDPTPTKPPEEIKASVKVSLRHVELFGRAVVSGRVTPHDVPGRTVVQLRRNGKVVKRTEVRVKKDGTFVTRLKVDKPGSYRAFAIVSGPNVRKAFDASASSVTALPSLSTGSRGPNVERLEKRLRYLGYYIPKSDRYFGTETSDALIAFNKVQGTSRVGYVGETTWRRLATPIRPKPRFDSKWHFEIDQTRQVVFVVKKGKVRWIVHTSTGAGGATHDGTFVVHRKLAGYSGNRLYYPSYWDGLRAFHGWPEVPTYPASHGCSRLPMWAATWMYGLAQIGDTVHVYH